MFSSLWLIFAVNKNVRLQIKTSKLQKMHFIYKSKMS